ncbi:MAG: hypothetical protein IRZ00_11310 [Gemmatimonadetes bacterium]|nr:hypothetical protein [Gemmatimonadota bacterium]
MSRLGRSARDRRALLLGAAAIVPGLLFRFAVVPYARELADARAAVQSERDLLARERGLRAEAMFLPAVLRQEQARFSTVKPLLFAGEEPALVAADVQDYIDEAAVPSRFRVDQMQTEPARSGRGGLIAVPLTVRGQTDFAGLLELLRRLAEGPKLLRVGRLVVEPKSPGSAGAPEPEVLSVTLRIEGFMLERDAVPAASKPPAGSAVAGAP